MLGIYPPKLICISIIFDISLLLQPSDGNAADERCMVRLGPTELRLTAAFGAADICEHIEIRDFGCLSASSLAHSLSEHSANEIKT